MKTLELTRSGVVATVAVFVVVAACVRLGFWQLDRRAQRAELNAVLADRLAAAPVTLIAPPLDTVGLTDRRAEVRGTFDNDRSFVLGGRSLGGAPGVHVFSPLRLGEGAILVNRGWMPAPDAATIDLEPLATEGPVSTAGYLLALPVTGTAEAGGPFRDRWFRLDAAPIRAQYPYPVSPLYLQAAAPAPGPSGLAVAGRAPIPLPDPAVDAGPHLSYALQWFSFALVFSIGWFALVMRRGRDATPSGTSVGDGRYQSRP